MFKVGDIVKIKEDAQIDIIFSYMSKDYTRTKLALIIEKSFEIISINISQDIFMTDMKCKSMYDDLIVGVYNTEVYFDKVEMRKRKILKLLECSK